MSVCEKCGKWAGAHATLPGQPRAHLCMCEQRRDCEHGQLARSCDRCADAKEIAELRAEAAANFIRAREWAERAGRLEAEAAELRKLLARYRDETPLGHQPHMIAHQADEALGRA
jgi:uncharacterized membrane protein YccC